MKSIIRNYEESELKDRVLGRTAIETIKYVFGKNICIHDIHKLIDEKEELYRQMYSKKIRATGGLIDLLKNLQSSKVKTGIATSAPKKNVDFVLNSLGIRHYFDVIVDADMVKKGKPAPDVYLTVAKYLKVDCSQCVVFEDSISGIEAARSAQMLVIGVTSTFKKHELKNAHYFVKDFKGMTIEEIINLARLAQCGTIHP